jgi:O-antigen ligase
VSAAHWLYCGCLTIGLLTLWVEGRWAWSFVQLGILVVAGRHLLLARPVRPAAYMAPLAFASVWPLLQLAAETTVSRIVTWEAALNWLTFLMACILAYELFQDHELRHRCLEGMSVFGMAVAAIGVLQNYSSGGKVYWFFASGFDEDVFGPFVNRNQFAAWLELLAPVSLYLGVAKRGRRALHGTAAAIMLAAIVSSGSRAAFLVSSVETLGVAALLAARHPGGRRAVLRCGASFVVVTALSVWAAGWQHLWTRLAGWKTEALRIDAFRASVEMVRDHPWAGTGIGTWPIVYPGYAGVDTGLYMNQAHNDWAQWAAEGGIPFLASMVIFAALLWKPAIRSIYGLGAVAFLSHCFVDYPMQQRPALAAWLFAAAGLAFAAGRAAESGNGLLPGIRVGANVHSGRDPARVQAAGATAPSGPLPRFGRASAGGTPDETAERNRSCPDRPAETGKL